MKAGHDKKPSVGGIRRIHITGASGTGTTTLGRRLAELLCCPHFDTDSFYWVPSDPPFIERRSLHERLKMMERALTEDSWVLSGSLDGWGDSFIPRFDAVIFLTLNPEIRLARLRRREEAHYIASGDPVARETSEKFIAWAAGYDLENPPPGRSRRRHDAWLQSLPCPVICLDSAQSEAGLAERALAALRTLSVAKTHPSRTAEEEPAVPKRVDKFMPNLTGEGANELLGAAPAPDPTVDEAYAALVAHIARAPGRGRCTNAVTARSIEELARKAKAGRIEKFVAGAAVMHRSGDGAPHRILLLKRAAEDFLGGLCELPSGGADAGENLIAALDREIEEETGLRQLEIVSHLGHFDYRSASGKRARQFNFLVLADMQEVRLNPKEHSKAYWLTKEEVRGTELRISHETRQIIFEAFDVLARTSQH